MTANEGQARNREVVDRSMVERAVAHLEGAFYYGLAEEVTILLENLDRVTAELEQAQRRLKNLAYIPNGKPPLPMILSVEAANGVHWEECSNCRVELITHHHDGGSADECPECGAYWWEGDLQDPVPTKDTK